MNAFLIILTICAVSSSTTGDSSAPPTEEDIRARTLQTNSVLKYETEHQGKAVICTWELGGRKAHDGLHIAIGVGGERKEFDVFVGKGIGRIIDINVKRHRVMGGDLIFGGVASLNAENQIEYRMFVVRWYGKKVPDSEHWGLSPVLLMRPHTDYVYGMSLSFVGGDSVMLGLHTLARSRDSVESHFFVNHCPMPGAKGELLGGTDYFPCLVNGGKGLTEFQLPVRPTP